MKMTLISAPAVLFLVSALLTFVGAGPSREWSDVQRHSLTLDGQPLTASSLIVNSGGVLAVVQNDFIHNTHKPVTFRVRLRRTSSVIHEWAGSEKEPLLSLQIARIWSVARLGDELVIESVRFQNASESTPTAEVISRHILSLSTIKWLSWPKQDGC